MGFYRFVLICFLAITTFSSKAQNTTPEVLMNRWVDSVFNALTPEQKIAQLMVIRAHSNLGADHVQAVKGLIKKYNVGGLCFFQGGPVRQAMLTNMYQSIAPTPLFITIDGEWGLGMRLDSVDKFPFQLTLGALPSSSLVYKMGLAIGEQCRRMGIQINYAPVVDVNNNPGNPVIGFRSFGENKNIVADYGIAYMKGMQDAGIMACAKHFPGHGDVNVDSHFDLPVINKTMQALEFTELMPFQALINAGVNCVMTAHLSVPSIDGRTNRPTSISNKAINDLLKTKMGFKGLTFTDALEMKGIAKYYPSGAIAVEALVAGNDVLCLPENVPQAIAAIKAAIESGKLAWAEVNEKVLKVLKAKYSFGLAKWQPIDATNLIADLNKNTKSINEQVAKNTITVLAKADANVFAELREAKHNLNLQKVAYIGVGIHSLSQFGRMVKQAYQADVFLVSNDDAPSTVQAMLSQVQQGGYKAIIISIHNYANRPANNYGLSSNAISIFKKLNSSKTITLLFGNVFAASNFCEASNLIACYQDGDAVQTKAAECILGTSEPVGKLPVMVCNFKQGTGISLLGVDVVPEKVSKNFYFQKIDSIAQAGIVNMAYPGCVVMAIQNGETIYKKAFGSYTYQPGSAKTSLNSIFDLASITKVAATTLAIMKLYENGKISLTCPLADYLPQTKKYNKGKLKIKDILLHQAGLIPYLSFYKELLNKTTGLPDSTFFSLNKSTDFAVEVAENLYLRSDWVDTLYKRIYTSPLGALGKYQYSDNDFIFLGMIVEKLTGTTLDQFVYEQFYKPMGLQQIGFKPLNKFSINNIVPTEKDTFFRHQLLQGHVHDEGAALFGGVVGHAGLFATVDDLAAIFKMLMGGGRYNGVEYFKKSTIQTFTVYQSKNSRRGYGFDKPDKDNYKLPEPYPCFNASPETFGHTGYTGTSVWADPTKGLLFIFLSNRVHPSRDKNLLAKFNIRTQIQDLFYQAISL